jgi:hypothetical protein
MSTVTITITNEQFEYLVSAVNTVYRRSRVANAKAVEKSKPDGLVAQLREREQHLQELSILLEKHRPFGSERNP